MSDDSATAILSAASESAEPSAPPAASEPTEQPTQPDSTPEAAPDQQAGQGAPSAPPTTAQLRQALKAARDSNPEFAPTAKALNDSLGRYEAYKEVFPTVDEARDIRTALDAVGGVEGLSEMQRVISGIEETDSLLDAGDPKVLDQIIEDSPEGFKKLAPHFLNRLAKFDQQTYARTVLPHLVGALNDAGLPNIINYLASKLGDKPDLLEVVNNVRQWYADQKALADRVSTDTISPERDAFEKERASFESERKQQFQSGIRQAMEPYIFQELGGRLKPYSAALQAMPASARLDVANACARALGEALSADKAYQRQLEAMMNVRKPDQAKIVALNKSKVSAVVDKVIESVVKSYGLKPGAAPRRAAAAVAAQTPSGPKQIVKLSQAPPDSQIDWNHEHMTDEAYIRHRAILRDGRWVSW